MKLIPIQKAKVYKILFLVLKVAIFLGALWFCYAYIIEQEQPEEIWNTFIETLSSGNWWLVSSAFIFVFLNWGAEGLKWKWLMQKTHPITSFVAVKAAFTGNAFGIFTPNRIGGFLGRIMYLPKEAQLAGTMNTFICNLAQMLATFIFGIIGALAIYLFDLDIHQEDIIPNPLYAALVFTPGVLIGLVVFFNPGWGYKVAQRIKFLRKHEEKLEFLAQHDKLLLLKVLAMSLLRYLVFALQFYFLLRFFSVDIHIFTAVALVGFLYLVISLIPTIMGKLGLREAAAVLIFGPYIASTSPIFMSSFSLWILNVAFASILGSLFFLALKRSAIK